MSAYIIITDNRFFLKANKKTLILFNNYNNHKINRKVTK